MPDQVFDIAQIALLGVALGMLIDIYRVIIYMFRPGKYLAVLYDLLFWFGCTLWAFVYLLGVNSGEARLYVLGVTLGGYIIEQRILGKSLRANLRSVLVSIFKGAKRVISSVAFGLDSILDAVTVPIRFLVRLAFRPLAYLLRLIFKPVRLAVRRARSAARETRAQFKSWWEGTDSEKKS